MFNRRYTSSFIVVFPASHSLVNSGFFPPSIPAILTGSVVFLHGLGERPLSSGGLYQRDQVVTGWFRLLGLGELVVFLILLGICGGYSVRTSSPGSCWRFFGS